MKHKTRQSVFCVFILAIMMSMTGCFSPVKYSGQLENQRIESRYGDIAMDGEIRDRWWEGYGDAELNAFIEIVLQESPTLQSAYLKIVDSEMALKQAKAGYYPNLSFNAGLGYGGQVSENSSSDPSYSLGLSLSYEIDLWGKVRAQNLISELSYESTQDQAASAALSLVTNVVTNWFTVKYYRDRKKLIEQQLELTESYYELVQEYYRSGQTNGMDVLEQHHQLETLRESLSEIDANIRITQHALEILAGGKAKANAEGSLPEAIDVGGTIPADKLIEMRPDIRIARRNAQRADAQIVIALADRLPSLRLSASLAFRSSSITELFKKLIWDLAASFSASLFDGFQKTTAIDRAKVSYLIESLTYTSTVLQAISDVENAILRLRLREQELVNARAQVERQKNILDVSRQYFANGTIDYNRMLSALKTMISTSQTELDKRRSLLNAQLDFFKSMGGGAWLQQTTEKGTEKAHQLLEDLDSDEDEKEQ